MRSMLFPIESKIETGKITSLHVVMHMGLSALMDNVISSWKINCESIVVDFSFKAVVLV